MHRQGKKDDDSVVVESIEVVRTKKARTVKLSAKPGGGGKKAPPRRYCPHCGARISG